MAIPRVERILVEKNASVSLAGLDILRTQADVIRVSAEDWIPYAILSDQFTGSSNADQRISRVKRVLEAESSGDNVVLSLHLKMHLAGKTKTQAEELRREILSRTEQLFLYARDVIGEDLFSLGAQVKRKNGDVIIEDASWIRGATLAVECEIVFGG